MRFRIARLREYLRSSLWFIPALCVVASVALALGMTALDRRVGDAFLQGLAFTGGPESARNILSTIAASMITFTGLVFTITIVVLQLASSQFSPRVLRAFLRDRDSQIALGIFVGTFAYALTVLREVRTSTETADAFVPGLGIALAFALVLLSLGAFIHYIHQVAQSIRAVNIIRSVHSETARLIDQRYPEEGPEPEELERRSSTPPAGEPDRVLHAGRAGVVTSLDGHGLARAAERGGCTIVLRHGVGDFVPEGGPLVEVYGDADRLGVDPLRMIGLGPERTMQEDVAFGFRQLVDIAERALSPGINDPTTAVQAIDRLHDLLRRLASRPLGERSRHAEDGRLLVAVPAPRWDDYVTLATDEIRQYGTGSIQVARRLRAMLFDLQTVVPPGRDAVLDQELELLDRMVDRSFPDIVDRVRGAVPDEQG